VAASDLTDIFKTVLEKLSALPGVVGTLASTVGRLTSQFTPLVSILNTATTAISAANSSSGKGASSVAAMDRNTAALTKLTTILEGLISAAASRVYGSSAGNALALGGGPRMLGPAGGGGGGTPSPPGSSGSGTGTGGAASALSKIAVAGAVAAAALGTLAVASRAVEDQFAKMVEYVRLFNPGVVEMFQREINNLGATIGRTFVPVIQMATDVVRQWSGTLAPIMASLAPVMRQLSETVGNILGRGMAQLGNIIRAMLPVFNIFLDVVNLVVQALSATLGVVSVVVQGMAMFARALFEVTGLGVILRTVTRMFEAFNIIMQGVSEGMAIIGIVFDALLSSLMGLVDVTGFINSAMAQLRTAVEAMVRGMLVGTIFLAKFVGALGLVNDLIAYAEGKTMKGDTAAQSPAIKGIEQIAKDMALAASTAGGASGLGVRSQEEFWSKTLQEMREAKKNGMSIQDLVKAILDELKKIATGGMFGGTPSTPPSPPGMGGIGGAIGGGLKGGAIGFGVAGPVGGLIGGAGGALGGLFGK
jgi:hypothetical protein